MTVDQENVANKRTHLSRNFGTPLTNQAPGSSTSRNTKEKKRFQTPLPSRDKSGSETRPNQSTCLEDSKTTTDETRHSLFSPPTAPTSTSRSSTPPRLSIPSPPEPKSRTHPRSFVTINFPPGSIGLQLEPCLLPASDAIESEDQHQTEREVGRIKRFADHGPQQPGAARASNKIHPGDLIWAVNGEQIHSYQQLIDLLRTHADEERSVTFENVWHSTQKTPSVPSIGNIASTTPTIAVAPKLEMEGRTPVQTPFDTSNLQSFLHSAKSHNSVSLDTGRKETYNLSSPDGETSLEPPSCCNFLAHESNPAEPKETSEIYNSPEIIQSEAEQNVSLNSSFYTMTSEGSRSRRLSVETPRLDPSMQIKDDEALQVASEINEKRAEEMELTFEMDLVEQDTHRNASVHSPAYSSIFNSPFAIDLHDDSTPQKTNSSRKHEMRKSLRLDFSQSRNAKDCNKSEDAKHDHNQEWWLAKPKRRVVFEDEFIAMKQQNFGQSEMEEISNTDMSGAAMDHSGVGLEELQNTGSDTISSSFQTMLETRDDVVSHRHHEDKEKAELFSDPKGADESIDTLAEATLVRESDSERVKLLQEQVDECNALIHQQQQKITDLTTELDEVKTECDELVFVLKDTAEEENKLSEALEQARVDLCKNREISRDVEDQLIERSVTIQTSLSERDHQLETAEQELQALRQKLQTSNEINDQLRYEFHRVADELESCKASIETLASQDENVVERDASPTQATFRLENQLIDARGKIRSLVRQVQSLESSYSVLTGEKDALCESMESLQAELRDSKRQLEDVERQLNEKKSDLIEERDAVDNLRSILARKSEEMDALERSQKTSRKQYEELNARLTQITTQAKKDKESFVEELIQSQDEAATCQRRISDLETILRSMRRNMSLSEERATAARDKLATERDTVKELRKQEEQIQEECERLRTELERSSTLRKQLQSERDQIQADFNASDRRAKESEAVLHNLRSEHGETVQGLSIEKDEIAHRLKEEEKKNAEVSQELRELKDVSVRLRREMETIKKQHENEMNIVKYDADLRAKQQINVEKEKDGALKMLSKTQEELRLVRNEMIRVEDSLQRSRQENELLSQKLKDEKIQWEQRLEDTLKSHASEFEEISKQKQLAEESRSRAETQAAEQLETKEQEVKAVKSDYNRLLSDHSQLMTQLEHAERQLDDKESALIQLKEEYVSCHDDEDYGALTNLPRATLRSRCIELQNEVSDLRADLEARVDENARNQRRMKTLESERASISDEMHRLIESNQHLDNRLRSSKELTSEQEGRIIMLNDTLETARADKMRLEGEINSQISISTGMNRELQELRQEANVAHEKLLGVSKENGSLKDRIEHLQSMNDEFYEQLSSKDRELKASEWRYGEASVTIRSLEHSLAEESKSLSALQDEVERLRAELQKAQEEHSSQLDRSRDESSTLRKRVAELELEIDNLSSQVRSHSEREAELFANVESHERACAESERHREETVERLSEATQIVVSQKHTIESLETSRRDAERQVRSLSKQVNNLETALRNMEARYESAGDHRMQQIQHLERRSSQLQMDKTTLEQERNKARDEARQLMRAVDEQKKANQNLQKRVDQMKDALSAVNAEVHALLLSKDEEKVKLRDATCEIETKQMEIDHLKARAQVLNATISRMKSDTILNQQPMQEAEAASTSGKQEEAISRLKSRIHTQDAKLQSVLEVFRSQQKVLSLTQSLEKQLLGFVDEVIGNAEGAIDVIARGCKHVEVLLFKLESSPQLQALDLVGIEKTLPFEEIKKSLRKLAENVPIANAVVQEEYRQLEKWKRRRAVRLDAETPQIQLADDQGSPSALKALDKMKDILNEELLSPQKMRSSEHMNFNAEYLQSVVHSLEGQIDGLLADLKSANDALRAKDQLFADLEQLLSHNEAEKHALEIKLKETQKDLEDARVAVSFHEPMESEVRSTDSNALMGQLLANIFENRDLREKGTAFRRWACETQVLRAIENQNNVAVELATQLNTTREKLMILKHHLKKSRRARTGGEVGLDRIDESKSSQQNLQV